MSAGRICEKHQQWCPNGECRWCEPADMAQSAGMLVPPEIAEGMREHWRDGVARVNGAPLEPLKFDEWTPGEPVTLDGVPVQWPSPLAPIQRTPEEVRRLTYPEWKQHARNVVIAQAALDAVGQMTLDQLLLRVNADEAKALRAFKLRLAEALAMSAKDAEESPAPLARDPFTIAAEAVQEVAREAGLKMDIRQTRCDAEWQIWASNIHSCVAVVQTISRLAVLQNNTPTRIRALVRSCAEACVRRLREPAEECPARTTEVPPK